MRSSLAAAAAISLLASASSAAGGQPPTAAPSVQQQFEAATAASEAGRWADALATYEGLEHNLKNARSLAIVRVRKGRVLSALGRFEEAAAALRQGIAALPA